jgi:hypothetical protein
LDLLILTEPEALTENGKSVLAYICQFFRENGYTVSPRGLAQHFEALEARIGYLLAELHRKGHIRLAGEGRFTILRGEEGDYVVPMLLPASVANQIDTAKVSA